VNGIDVAQIIKQVVPLDYIIFLKLQCIFDCILIMFYWVLNLPCFLAKLM